MYEQFHKLCRINKANLGTAFMVVWPGMERAIRYYYTFFRAGFYNGISESHTIYGGTAFYIKYYF